MRNKHTTGPWRVTYRNLTGQYHINFNGKNQLMDNKDFNENVALIAAAPEMFEALEKIQETLLEKHKGTENHTYEMLLLSDVIKKAKGE